MNKSETCIISNYFPLDQKHINLWNDINNQLEEFGINLLLLTTKSYRDLQADQISIPYNPIDFNHSPSLSSSINYDEDLSTLAKLSRELDRRPHNERELTIGLSKQRDFYRKIIREKKPFAVFGWNATHPQTQEFIFQSQQLTIPSYYIERGLLADTLMLDTMGLGATSELQQNPTLRNTIKNISNNFNVNDWKYMCELFASTRTDRYPTNQYISKAEIINKYKIKKPKILLLMLTAEFTHTGCKTINRYRYQDPYFSGNLSAINSIQEAIKNHDNYQLVVQDHPLNENYYNIHSVSDQIVITKESIHSLFNAADSIVFYGSTTTQIDCLFYQKPIGLLSKTILSGYELAHQYNGKNLLNFIENLETNDEIEKNRYSFIKFISEMYLYKYNASSKFTDLTVKNSISDLCNFINFLKPKR